MMLKEYFGITDDQAFSGLVVAGFTAIMIGSVFLIISLTVVNSVNTATGVITGGSFNTTQVTLLNDISQALQIGSVALIIVGVTLIIAVLLGVSGGQR